MAVDGARDPRIETTLKEKWTLESRIGSGGVATVYAARHRQGARVAIKILNRDVARNKDVRARFLREGYVANTVDHPGVVRVLDDDVTEDGLPFLVMDLLEGELADDRRIRLGGRLPLSEAVHIADRVLDVLAAAHGVGVVHRDVKPENVFLCNDGSVRLLDFGIARLLEPTGHETTKTGVLVGTPEFMSPEQANGIPEAVDSLTDVWGVGATIFALLSGEAVHTADTLHAQIFAAASQPARSLGAVVRDAPRQLVAVVDRALAFDKRDRWQSARAMQLALAGITTSTTRKAAQEVSDDDPTTAMAGHMVAPRRRKEPDIVLPPDQMPTIPRRPLPSLPTPAAAPPAASGPPAPSPPPARAQSAPPRSLTPQPPAPPEAQPQVAPEQGALQRAWSRTLSWPHPSWAIVGFALGLALLVLWAAVVLLLRALLR